MGRNEFKGKLKFESNNISEQDKQLHSSFHQLNDKYIEANTLDVIEYCAYLLNAVRLRFKNIHPDLSIYIPVRVKSDDSTSKNYSKAFQKIITQKYQKGDNEIDLYDIFKDFIGATIVLDDINSSRESKTKYVSSKISEYEKLKSYILSFVDDTNLLLENDMIDEETYIKLKEKTLKLILQSTYPEQCYNERTISYDTELKEVEKSYTVKSENDSFLPSITDAQVKNLKKLLLDLRSRSSDKLQHEILKEVIPNVFNSPLINNALLANIKFEKEVFKPNGFVALYYSLETPFGLIELQAQSSKRYYESKKGSAFHSAGKAVDITSFFELVNPDDEHTLSFYLNKLDNIEAEKILSDVEIPKFKSEEEKYKFLNSPERKIL